MQTEGRAAPGLSSDATILSRRPLELTLEMNRFEIEQPAEREGIRENSRCDDAGHRGGIPGRHAQNRGAVDGVMTRFLSVRTTI